MRNSPHCSNLSQWVPELYSNRSVFQELSFTQISQLFMPWSFALKTWLAPAWCLLGLCGNSLSFLVWSSPRIRRINSSAVYLMTLSLSDLLFILLYFTDYASGVSEIAFFSMWKHHAGMCELFQVAYVFTQYFPVTLTAAFTVERWVSVCHPFLVSHYHRNKSNRSRRVLRTLLLLALGNLALSLFAGLLWSIDPVTHLCEANRFRPEYLYLSEFIISVILPLCILVLNCRVIAEMRRISRSTAARTLHPPSKIALVPSTEPPQSQSSNAISQRRLRKTSPSSVASVSMSGVEVTGFLCPSTTSIPAQFQRLSTPLPPSPNDMVSPQPQTRLSRSTTLLLLGVSFLLILAVLPVGLIWCCQVAFPHGHECIRLDRMATEPQWRRYFIYQAVKLCVDSMLLSHYACNFLIYLATSPMFRTELHLVLSSCCGPAETRNCYLLHRHTMATAGDFTFHRTRPPLSVILGNPLTDTLSLASLRNNDHKSGNGEGHVSQSPSCANTNHLMVVYDTNGRRRRRSSNSVGRSSAAGLFIRRPSGTLKRHKTRKISASRSRPSDVETSMDETSVFL